MTEFSFGPDYDDQIRILKESIGLNSKDLSPNILNNYYYPFIVGVFNENKALTVFNIKEKYDFSSAEYHLLSTDNKKSNYFLQLSSIKSETDSSYNIKLEFIKPSEGFFEKPEVLNIDLNTELGKNIIFRMRDDIFKKHNEGMGHLLAEACIKIESNVPIFYSRIGYETVENKYQKCKSNLYQDISNAVKEAKQKGRRIATVLVSCRYSSTGTNDNGHTICIAVNTDKFDNNGELLKDSKGNPIKLTQNDCTIIDSSRAIIDTIHENPRHDNGIIEISSKLNQLIDTGNIEAYSLYPVSIQVGPKCSDYTRRAYQKISSGNYENIKDLRNKSFEFASSIHNDIKNDYERILDKDIPINIRNELNNKKPKKEDYPKEERSVSLAAKQYMEQQPKLGKKRAYLLNKTPTSEQGSVVSVEHNSTLKNLKFRPKFNPYVRSSHFSPTKLSKKITNTDHGRSF